MNTDERQILVGIALSLAVLTLWLCSLGVLRAQGFYSRLHFLGPATLLGGPFVALATIADGTSGQAIVKAITLATILIVSGPVTSHALARAARVRETGKVESRSVEIKRGNNKS